MTGELERPIAADWLALREPADTRTRDVAAEALLPDLVARLTREDGAGLTIVDLGAGTGANLRWLASRLPEPDRQHWLLVDHDPGLLARGPVHATAVRADVTELARVLAEARPPDREPGVDLVTAAALLDLLTPDQVGTIVDAVVDAGIPALFSLSVTGEVSLDPAEAEDGELAAAFDAHQRRGGRLGPDAGPAAAARFRSRGWSVTEVRTPWRLGPPEGTLLEAWLDGWAGAAVEHRPDLAGPAAAWLDRRRAQLGRGALRVQVGHIDVLTLPPNR